MLAIFDGTVVPTQSLPTKYTVTQDTILYVNIYNMSPHALYFSLSNGSPDIFVPPNYTIEGLYMGIQGGAELSVGNDRSTAQQILLTKISTSTALQTFVGNLAIIGFRKDENWQGVRPLITGSLVPFTGNTVATSLVNTNQPGNTNVINTSAPIGSGTPNGGSFQMSNDGARTVTLNTGGGGPLAVVMEQLTNGGVLLGPSAAYGSSTHPTFATFYGSIQGGQPATVGAITGIGANSLDGGLVTTDGSGNITRNSDELATPASPTTLVTGSTITPAGAGAFRVTEAAAVTGIIIAASGSTPWRELVIFNEGSFTATMATAATSHVANGVNCILQPLSAKHFWFNNALALWYEVL